MEQQEPFDAAAAAASFCANALDQQLTQLRIDAARLARTLADFDCGVTRSGYSESYARSQWRDYLDAGGTLAELYGVAP